MVERPKYLARLAAAVKRSPVTALLGPRQCGKTTLARAFSGDKEAAFYDLESEPDRRRLQNPQLALEGERGLVVLDEVQAMPELFNVLRVLADRPARSSRFLVLGSASPGIVRAVSESLAGRVEFVELCPFDASEAGPGSWEKLWLRGGFPRSLLARSASDSFVWREGFIRTFLERDVPQLGIGVPPAAMRRFWTMLAHYHGQTWNGSEIARGMGLSDKTVRSYLDVLTGTFMVRQLQPWHENLGKRQVKAPKVYLRDSGVLHGLLGLADRRSLLAHPKVGASWEGFALEAVVRALDLPEVHFWASHGGAEIDMLFERSGRRYGIEFKFTEAPAATRSMLTARDDLSLDHVWVVYPGKHDYPIDERLTAWPLADVPRLAGLVDGRCRPSVPRHA
jgi:predicted AAA+ superfamily ATPase